MVECHFEHVADDGFMPIPRVDLVKGLWFPASPRVGELVYLRAAVFRVAQVLWVPKGITAAAVVYLKPL